MSRFRIVGGTITKTTKGAHHMYAGENIVFSSSKTVTETGDENGVVFGKPKDAPKIKKMDFKTSESKDFGITLELDKKVETFVPFGIKDFEQNEENQFFRFKLKISGDGVNNWQLDIKGKKGIIYTCYSATQELQEVVITSKSKKGTVSSNKPNSEVTSSLSFWPAGEYVICWDGFDNNDIYDSTLFNGEKLEAKITGAKEGNKKNVTVDFSAEYSQVLWTDIKINRKIKRIDVTLRVNLTDGGFKGLSCWNNTRNFNPRHTKPQICDWDKIPVSEINPKHPIRKTKTKTFAELKKIAFDGLVKYWGRNKMRKYGDGVNINSDRYEIFIDPNDSDEKAMNSLPLIYNTNGDWMRSGNSGGVYKDNNLDDNVLNIIPDTGIIQRLSYNTGYIKHAWKKDSHDGWRYYTEKGDSSVPYDAITEFEETAAHELGHELLQAYGGTVYSWQHKGSSYYLPQDTKPIKSDETLWDKATHWDEMNTGGEYYPKGPREIDLMKYYNSKDKNGKFVSASDLNRTVASEKDVLGLVWLTKLKIK